MLETRYDKVSINNLQSSDEGLMDPSCDRIVVIMNMIVINFTRHSDSLWVVQ